MYHIIQLAKDSTKFVRRSIKNEINNYDKGERLVRELTSNEYGLPSTQMLIKLKVMTTDPYQFPTVVQMLFKRLTDYKYKHHVYKSLICIEYLIKHADRTFVTYCQENIDSIQKLTRYRYILGNNNGVPVDYGGNVRKRAKRITDLLSNEQRLRTNRAKAQGYYSTELEDQKLQKELEEINAILNRTKKPKEQNHSNKKNKKKKTKERKINKQQNINSIFPEIDGDEWMANFDDLNSTNDENDKLSQQTTDEIDIFGINYSDAFFSKSNDKNKQVENTINDKTNNGYYQPQQNQPQQSNGFELF